MKVMYNSKWMMNFEGHLIMDFQQIVVRLIFFYNLLIWGVRIKGLLYEEPFFHLKQLARFVYLCARLNMRVFHSFLSHLNLPQCTVGSVRV